MEPNPFELARRVACVSIAELGGRTALKRSKRDLYGPCPLCGGEADSKRFHVTPAKNTWYCFACQRGGGPVELECAITGATPIAAARLLAELPPAEKEDAPASRPSPAKPGKAITAATARDMWRLARPARGTIVENWFRARALDPALHGYALSRGLRFHPRALAAAEWERGRILWERRAPAMLAPLCTYSAQSCVWIVVGVHATFLAPNGEAKAELYAPDGEEIPARKMFGRAAGACAPLTELRGDGPLIVGEGYETTASIAQPLARAGIPYRAAATLTLNNLQGGWLLDANGRSFWPALADPERPPWTMPHAGDVIVGVDRDMSPIRLKRRRADGSNRSESVMLDADARAEMCGALASQHWRNAGASSVTILTPRLYGYDFNDLLREGLAHA